MARLRMPGKTIGLALMAAFAVSILVVGCSQGASQENTDELNTIKATAPTVNPQTDLVASQLLEQSERIASLEQQLAKALAGSIQPLPPNVGQVAIPQTNTSTLAPQYSPSPKDFTALAFNRVRAMKQSEGSPWDYYARNFDSVVKDRYWQYASVYIASACVAVSETSFEGFREFLDQNLLMVRSGKPVINLSGEEAVSQIISTAEGIPNIGPSSQMSDCMRRYLYPTSYSDATPAIELVKSFKDLHKIGVRFRDGYKRVQERFLFRDFGAWAIQSEPFLPWLCEQIKPDDYDYVSCRIEVEVVKQFQVPR